MSQTIEHRSKLWPDEKSSNLSNTVRTFVSGRQINNDAGRKLTSQEHARCAIQLLKSMPVSRYAVLEYFCHLFDDCVNSFITEMEGQESLGPNLDEVALEVEKILKGYTESNPQNWSPLVFNWSVNLLGKLSSKYADRQAIPHSSSLESTLQMWTNCPAAKALLEIISSCMSVLNYTQPDVCINTLLETSVANSPNFDWVVAHIGSQFPQAAITRLLSSGLEDFCQHTISPNDNVLTCEKNVPKMASVVSILGHLAISHAADVKNATLSLFQLFLETEGSEKLSTVPYLLQLATMSPLLLQTIATDFINSLTVSTLNKFYERFTSTLELKWDREELISLVVHLVCKAGMSSFTLLLFLLKITSHSSDSMTSKEEQEPLQAKVQSTACLIMDLVLLDLQKSVYNKSGASVEKLPERSSHTEKTKSQPAAAAEVKISFLSELQDHIEDICNQALTAEGKKLVWLERLLSLIGIHCGVDCASNILTYFLLHSESVNRISIINRLHEEMEKFFSQQLFFQCIQKSSLHFQSKKCKTLLENLLQLVMLERSNGETKNVCCQALVEQLDGVANLLFNADIEVCQRGARLLCQLSIPDNLSPCTLIKLATATTHHLFRFLHFTSELEKPESSDVSVLTCTLYLEKLCKFQTGQYIVLQYLMRAGLSQENSFLFGGREDQEIMGANEEEEYYSSLYNYNQQQGLSVTLPPNTSSVFHAGVIGQGPKKIPRPSIISKDLVSSNTQYFLECLWNCASEDAQKQASSLEKSRNGFVVLASLLLELVCPEVTQIGVWPDESSIKFTVERDLLIRKNFQENPILWEILKIVSKVSSGLSHCRILVSSLMAVLMTYWEGCRHQVTTLSPWHLKASTLVVECMALAGWLPPPLCYVGELFHLLTPFKVFSLLKTLWEYMKENFSTESAMNEKKSKYSQGHAKYRVKVRSIVHHDIEKFGHVYSRIFISSS